VLEAVDGFDERFPRAAGEDVDLSWRLRTAGWRLVLEARCSVRHDHRATLPGVLRTYAKHGRARALLRALHSADSVAAAGARAVCPSTLGNRWRRYRASGASPATALAYLLLRAVGLGCYLSGFLRAPKAALPDRSYDA
jgi:GT2 family glycosyltransferase